MVSDSDWEDEVAAEGDTQGDMQAHVKSYSAFAWMMKWGTVASLLVAFVVVLMIAS